MFLNILKENANLRKILSFKSIFMFLFVYVETCVLIFSAKTHTYFPIKKYRCKINVKAEKVY